MANYSAEVFAGRVEEAYMNAISRHVRAKAIRRANVGKLHFSKKYNQAKLVPPEEDKHFLKEESDDPKAAQAREAYQTANRYADLVRVGRKVKAKKKEAMEKQEKKEQ